ncbi:MAG: translation initiation factor IF-2 [Lachnospiraceae bacterium]|jgi:translation initiation factor IF-2|uniref:translation initiation factor IF-2 n=1 Tax=Clostridia TaxID=186801 RepID=UPI000E510A85|nr:MULTISPECIES: translation initiation factor IF-2 [Clostridia]MBS5190020.1 translation initiation factor IF-2 [Lachnospiraceae bacterium]RHV70815.1 translation initiation factor IF-2 [Roseburia sp. OM02-15]
MAKIRVHEIAKEYNVPAKDVMTFLEGHNIEVSSHMSTLEDNAVALVRGKYGKSGEADADKKERPKKKSSISAVYNPQNSKMSNRRSNNGNRNGDRPQRQNGDRPQRANGENRQRQDGDRPRYDNRQRQNGDRPQRQNGDRPRYDGDRSQRPNGDRPARNGDRPQRRYGDRPARQENGDRNGRYERKDNNNQKGFQGNRGGGNNFGGNRNNRQDNSGRSRESRGRLDHDISRMNRDNKASIEELRGKENTHVNKKKNKQDYERKNRKQEQYVNLEKKTGHKKRNAQPQPQAEKKTDEVRSISLPEVMTVRELAERIDVPASKVVEKLFMQGILATVNQEVDYEKAEEIALEFNCIAEPEEKVDVIAELLKEEEEDENTLVSRPPVVCVMGHVDHGKTSLLDAIRETHVTDREAGGITQHIGASVVQINGQKITFLDTPGHEAFTAMRMRGANSTDIAILVVAADDGIMPQTIEAISHAKAAGIEIIVAINKIDKESANIDYVKQGLAEQGLIPEDWGGSTICVPVSARTGEGITELLEMVLLTADILELKANPKRKARGLVIEAQLDKGRGAVATVLVQKGTLKVGEPIAAGSSYGKVRAMIDDKGRRVKEAGPSTPVEILGLNSVPNAGEVFVACDSDKDARSFADTFVSQNREKMLEETRSRMSLDDLFSQIQTGNLKELELIVKADVQGSVEAVKQSLTKLSNEEVVVKVIHGGVGAINESDVSLASASNAIIIGFNVKPDATAKATAEQEHVDIRLYSVIYKAIEDIEAAMKGMLDPIFEEKVIGHAEVRQIFKASGVGNIAGSYILDGVFERNCKVRITREGKQIFEGDLASLKRFKDDVKEVKAGYECGLVFEGFNDIAEFDVVEAYKMVEVPR